jgi:hypothetical protein
VGEIGDDRVEVTLGDGGEGGVEPLVEFFQRQPAERVVLAQRRRGRLPVSVADPQVWSRRHQNLHVPRR